MLRSSKKQVRQDFCVRCVLEFVASYEQSSDVSACSEEPFVRVLVSIRQTPIIVALAFMFVCIVTFVSVIF